jgi:hypothetical protein
LTPSTALFVPLSVPLPPFWFLCLNGLFLLIIFITRRYGVSGPTILAHVDHPSITCQSPVSIICVDHLCMWSKLVTSTNRSVGALGCSTSVLHLSHP